MKIRSGLILLLIILALFSCAKPHTDISSENIYKDEAAQFSFKVLKGYEAVPEEKKDEYIKKFVPDGPPSTMIFLNKQKRVVLVFYKVGVFNVEREFTRNKIFDQFESNIPREMKKIHSSRNKDSIQISAELIESDKFRGMVKLLMRPDPDFPTKKTFFVSFFWTEKKYYDGVEADFFRMINTLKKI